MTVRLLAASPTGDVFFTEDERGVLRRHLRYGLGEPLVIGQRELDRALYERGLPLLDQEFSTWQELDSAVDQLVTPEEIDVASLPLGPRALAGLPQLLRTHTADEGQHIVVIRAVVALLKRQEVRDSPEVEDQLLEILDSVNAPAVRHVNETPMSRTEIVHSYYDSQAA